MMHYSPVLGMTAVYLNNNKNVDKCFIMPSYQGICYEQIMCKGYLIPLDNSSL